LQERELQLLLVAQETDEAEAVPVLQAQDRIPEGLMGVVYGLDSTNANAPCEQDL
jgi:hypothetical protein